MSDKFDHSYFDAKFNGIEKLMASQETNLKGYIGAVSKNVTEVRDDLAKHKESVDAHGVAASSRTGAGTVAWASLAVAVLTAIAIAAPLFHKAP